MDYSQRTADGDDEERPAWAHLMPKWWYSTPPALRSLRAAYPYWGLWTDPEKMQEMADALDRANGRPTKENVPLQSDEATATEPSEEGRARGTRAPGQRYSTDRKIGGVHPGEAQPDSSASAERQRQASSDMTFLENPQSWNRSRKL